MKKRIGIITINDNDNYGNRVQNYAVQEFLKKEGYDVVTIKNISQLNNKNKMILRYIKYILTNLIRRKDKLRLKRFKEFNKNIKFSNHYITPYTKDSKKYDYFFVR